MKNPKTIKRRQGEAKEFSRGYVVTLKIPVSMFFDKNVTTLPEGLVSALAEEVAAHPAVSNSDADPSELINYITSYNEVA